MYLSKWAFNKQSSTSVAFEGGLVQLSGQTEDSFIHALVSASLGSPGI